MATEAAIDLDDFHNEDDSNEGTVDLTEDSDDLDNTDLENEEEENEEDNTPDNVGNAGSSDDTEVLTGIEKFLTTHGIEGGMIEFEDGVKKHYDDLTQEEQFNVLKTIAESEKNTVESQFDLDPEEISLLNYVRDSGKTVQQAFDDIVEAELSRREMSRIDQDVDYLKLSPEAVYLKWLKNSDPDISDDDLQDALDAAKKTKTFSKQAETIRKGFIQDQERLVEVEQSLIEQERLKDLESDRETIVNEVMGIDSVAGWEINDDQKNAVLASLLETNSHGDSLFMEKVFSDPKKLFEVAWMEMFGNEYYDKMGEHYKNKISDAYARGRREGVSGLPTSPINTGNNRSQKNNTVNPVKREENNAMSMEDLHKLED